MADGQKARIPNVLSIAGIDPSGGAGLLADVKAISACGAYACGVVAALTAQNTCGVDGVMPVPKEFVRAQLDTLWADVEIDAVKIGMLNDAEVISVVAEALRAARALGARNVEKRTDSACHGDDAQLARSSSPFGRYGDFFARGYARRGRGASRIDGARRVGVFEGRTSRSRGRARLPARP